MRYIIANTLQEYEGEVTLNQIPENKATEEEISRYGIEVYPTIIIIGEDGYRKDCDMDIKITQCLEIRKDKNTTPIKKSNCLTTVMKDNVISSLPPGRYPNAFDMKDKFRYLTPVEMCRLQTLPDDYLDGIAPNTAMSLAGNGWTVDVIAHLLRSIERKQINDIVKEFRKITDELMFGSLETDIM